MKHQTTKPAFTTDVKAIAALAAGIIANGEASATGRANYLRSLLAGTQEELVGKPVLRSLRSSRKVTPEEALAAFEKVNDAYYAAVLTAVPEEFTALERQAKTSFARSSASTLRRALSLKWDPLTPVTNVTKGALYEWSNQHRAKRVVTLDQAQSRVVALVEKIQETIKELPPPEAEALLRAAVAELVPDVQRMRDVSLRRHARPEAPAAH